MSTYSLLSTEFGLAASLDGWDLLSATGISGDGRVIAGAGIGPTGEFEAWRAVLDPSTELPADYNDDGIVDAADYTRWRDALGGTAGQLENNINGGPISTAHYDTWKDIFGAASPGNASFASMPAVPEPGSATLLVLQLAGLFWITRERRSRLISRR